MFLCYIFMYVYSQIFYQLPLFSVMDITVCFIIFLHTNWVFIFINFFILHCVWNNLLGCPSLNSVLSHGRVHCCQLFCHTHLSLYYCQKAKGQLHWAQNVNNAFYQYMVMQKKKNLAKIIKSNFLTKKRFCPKHLKK